MVELICPHCKKAHDDQLTSRYGFAHNGYEVCSKCNKLFIWEKEVVEKVKTYKPSKDFIRRHLED